MVRKSTSKSVVSTTATAGGSAAAAQPALEPKAPRTKPASRPRKSSTPARQSTNGHEPSSYEVTRDDIARLAYTLWEQRGGEGGSPDEDWLRAENELRSRTSTAA